MKHNENCYEHQHFADIADTATLT